MEVICIFLGILAGLVVIAVFKRWQKFRPPDIDVLLGDNLETFDQTTQQKQEHPSHTTSPLLNSHDIRNRFHSNLPSSRPFFDTFDSAAEDSDVEARVLVSNLKKGVYSSEDILADVAHSLDNSIKSLEEDFITRSEDLCKALDKIDSLNIKEENKDFLVKNLDTNKDTKHSALKALMQKRQEYNTGRIFNKSQSSWKTSNTTKSTYNSKSFRSRDVVKGETVDQYSSYRRGPLSPKEKILENIKNLRESPDDEQILPSKAKLPQYAPVEEKRAINRPRGIFTPKIFEKVTKEKPLQPGTAPFSYMNSAKPMTDMNELKTKKLGEPVNPVTSDNHPLTNGVKRGSVKNLAALFDSSNSLEKQSPSLKQSTESGINTHDLTISTKFTDNTDMDIDTSIMDESGSNVSIYCKETNVDTYCYSGASDDESNSSLSRAISPVFKSKRFKEYKNRKNLSNVRNGYAKGKDDSNNKLLPLENIPMPSLLPKHDISSDCLEEKTEDISDRSDLSSSSNSLKENSCNNSFNMISNKSTYNLDNFYFKTNLPTGNIKNDTASLTLINDDSVEKTEKLSIGILEYQQLFSERKSLRENKIKNKKTVQFNQTLISNRDSTQKKARWSPNTHSIPESKATAIPNTTHSPRGLIKCFNSESSVPMRYDANAMVYAANTLSHFCGL